MANKPYKAEIDSLTAELMASDVSYQLGVIATAQHRIACAMKSEHRTAVLGHLRRYGISEQAGRAYVNEPLSSEDLKKLIADELDAFYQRLRKRYHFSDDMFLPEHKDPN